MSRFKSLLDVAKNRDLAVSSSKGGGKKTGAAMLAQQALNQGRRGRPAGKRSNPDYEQVTAYIRKDTHKSVKIALLQEGQGRQFSELIEDLLSGWLEAHN